MPLLPLFERRKSVTVQRELTVLNRTGLHARPAAEFVRCALAFRSEIILVVGGKNFSAERILDVLLADLSLGSAFTLAATGPDAEAAVARLEQLLIELRDADDSNV